MDKLNKAGVINKSKKDKNIFNLICNNIIKNCKIRS